VSAGEVGARAKLLYAGWMVGLVGHHLFFVCSSFKWQ
jgi:hypothetical protein